MAFPATLSAQIPMDLNRIQSLAAPVFSNALNRSPLPETTTPKLGEPYTIVPGLGGLAPDEPGAGSAFFVGLQGTAETGLVEDSILDGALGVIGRDFADMVDPEATASDVVTFERLFVRGKDAATGRFVVELNLTIQATGDFPLNPDGLPLQAIDIDGDGVDELIELTDIALFVGAGVGGTAITFDPEAGVPVVLAAFWDMIDFGGNFIFDFDGDGVGDPADITGFPEFNCPVLGGWNGSLGISFIPDADPETPDTTTNDMQTSQLRVFYLSNLATEFGFICGDVNMDGTVSLLDIGPFVQLIINNGFQIEADINEDGAVNLIDIQGFIEKLLDV